MEICEPAALARLPKPLSSGGKVQFGSVWALHGQTRKRRHEICTGTDGDSLSIYEVQNGRAVLSHAVPPSVSFACPPTSIRWKEDGAIHRQTCFLARDDGLHLRSLLTQDGLDGNRPSIHSTELENHDSPVINLDILPIRQTRAIATVQADGTFTMISSDLKNAAIKRVTNSENNASIKVVAAAVLSAGDAWRTVLKARQDLARDVPSDSAILVAAFKARSDPSARFGQGDLHFGVWSVSFRSSNLDLHFLFDHKLSLGSSDLSKKQAGLGVSFGPRAATLVLKSMHGLLRFDLTGLVPRKLPELRPNIPGHQDLILVSESFALVSYSDSLRLLDLEYEVTQTHLDLNQTLLRRKRKRSGSEASGAAIDFVCYFAHMSRVLIHSRSHLIACDLRLPKVNESGRKLSSLVENIGRARTSPQHIHRPLNLEIAQKSGKIASKEDWATLRTSLGKMQQTNDVAGFDARLLKFLKQQAGIDTEGAHNRPRHSTNGLSEAQVDEILSSLFNMKTIGNSDLENPQLYLNLNAPKSIRWLTKAGVLSKWRLERALSSSPHAPAAKIGHGEIAQSLVDADPTLDTLLKYVDACGNNDHREQAATIRLLLSQVLNQSYSTAQRMITDGDHEQALGGLSERHPDAVPQDHQSDEATMKVLTLALDRLGLADVKSISSTVRGSFSGTELLGLIQLLRQHLFKTGFPASEMHFQGQAKGAETEISLPTNPVDDLAGRQVAKVSMSSILKMLSACVDAAGPLDLLSTEETDAFIENVIPDLLSEVSLATEAAEESADMQGSLREMLRYTQDKKSGNRRRTRSEVALPLQQPGEIVTLYTEQSGDQAANGQADILPLSLHAEDAISPLKVRKGGGQISKRSLRHTLMLESRQKGAYSFERLVL